jgi:hypothetical protein
MSAGISRRTSWSGRLSIVNLLTDRLRVFLFGKHSMLFNNNELNKISPFSWHIRENWLKWKAQYSLPPH